MSERLKDRHLFNLAFKKRLKLHSKLLTLYYLLKKKDINRFDKGLDFPKTAFAVGVNINKSAVKRNLIKRRIREAYKIVKKNLNLENNSGGKRFQKISVLIWVANPAIKDATFIQVKDSVENLLNKLNIVENPDKFQPQTRKG